MVNISPPSPMERFFAHMDWPVYVREHKDFPLHDFRVSVDLANRMMYVVWEDKRTGEVGAFGEDIQGFPSAVLVARFQLLVGPIEGVRADYRRLLNRRTRGPAGKYRGFQFNY